MGVGIKEKRIANRDCSLDVQWDGFRLSVVGCLLSVDGFRLFVVIDGWIVGLLDVGLLDVGSWKLEMESLKFETGNWEVYGMSFKINNEQLAIRLFNLFNCGSV